MNTTLTKYEMHNKLLNAWTKIFPGITADSVDKSDHWHELRDKSGDKMMRLANGRLVAWNKEIVVFNIKLSLLPFEL